MADEKTERDVLVSELYAVNREICEERERFKLLRDEDLLDETIYRLMALTGRQRYLIKKIKEKDAQNAAR